MADQQPGTSFFIGVADQSVRTHFKNGRLADVDPRHYDIWTESLNGSRTQAKIFLRRKP